MYYFLKTNVGKDYEYKVAFGVLYNRKAEVVNKIFADGVSLNESHKDEEFTIIINEKESSKGAWADTVKMLATNAGSIFIATDKTCSLFQELELKNLEYFNLKIKTKNRTLENYKIINVVGKIDCIDDKSSDITFRRDGTIRRINKLHFDEEKIPDELKIFLLGRKKVAVVIVHEIVKNAIEENLSGFQLIHINDYQGR